MSLHDAAPNRPPDAHPRKSAFRRSRWAPLSASLLASVALCLSSGCMTAYRQGVGGDTSRNFGRYYLTDFNTAWQATLDSLKSARLDVSNRDAGFIQTRWTENTAEKNFIDSFGNADSYLKAQYRFRISVGKGYYNGAEAVKVSVQKDQVIQRDVLEGWRPVETDEIEERTLLYRIGRLIYIRTKMAKLEEDRTKHQMEQQQGGKEEPPAASPGDGPDL